MSSPTHTFAASLDLPSLKSQLRSNSSAAQSQDPTTQRTPLHVVIDALDSSSSSDRQKLGEDCLRELLSHGAIWNDLDSNDETPGCIAWRKGLTGCYEVMVEAGVRAEVLLGRLSGYEQLGDGDSEEEEDELPADVVEKADEVEDPELLPTTVTPATNATAPSTSKLASPPPEGARRPSMPEPEGATEEDSVTAAAYLSSHLQYSETKLVDADQNGVMMEWERGIMKRSVEELLKNIKEEDMNEVSILNVGFGLGIVDSYFQERLQGRGRHVIIEPHPDVLNKIRETGWDKKPGVEICAGRWQDQLPEILASGSTFTAIYFDTFAEPYTSLKTFFNEGVVALLSPDDGRFSFFHGLGADRRISWDVYTRVVELDLSEAGMETTWVDVQIEGREEERTEGIKRSYWNVGDTYRLPLARFSGLEIE